MAHVFSVTTKDSKHVVIFEDSNISVIFHRGSSDYLLITFGDLINLANDDHFYAENPAKKLSISCLGFMAKEPNWFPTESVEAAYKHVFTLVSHFEQRVTYGGSMGGYAAIKFSALLNANQAIAFCPQWSIDREECDGFDSGWSGYFSPSMKGMGIKARDMKGNIFCFADRSNKTDLFHVERIAVLSKNVTIINIPTCGHHITAVLAGTENINTLIYLCRANDISRIRSYTSQIRKNNIFRKTLLVERAINRYPNVTINILHKRRFDIDFAIIMSKHIFDIIEFGTKHFDYSKSIDLLNVAQRYLPTHLQLKILLLKCSLFKHTINITTCHNTIFVYDCFLGFCIHITEIAYYNDTNRYHIVSIQRSKQSALIYSMIGGSHINFRVSEIDQHLHPSLTGISNDFLFDVVDSHSGIFSLHYNGLYLSAQIDGDIIVDRPNAGDWELLTLGSI
jgi:hypothetical protein